MTITYLDQNAASYLATAKPGSIWEAIRAALIKGYQDDHRIICPMPFETLVESAPCDVLTRLAIEHFFQDVSGGTRFRTYSEILVDKTLALVREGHQAVAFGTIDLGWATRESAAQLVKQAHVETRARMRQRVEAYQFPAGAEHMTAEEIFKSSCLDRSGMLWRDLERFVSSPATVASDYETSWLMKGLIDQSLTIAEAQRLAEAVRHHRWETIYVNFFDIRLGSRWDHDMIQGQRPRYQPNDEFDRWRAAVALGHSDLFITDSYISDLCRRARVGEYSPTVTFSTKQADSILAFLSDSCAQAHEQRV